MSSLGNKDIMAKNIKRLMEVKGKDRTEICKDLNVAYTTFTDWINAKTYPRIDKIEKMANYFGVTKADLVEETAHEYPSYYDDPEIQELADFMHKNPEYKVLFDASKNVKKEDIEFVREFMDRMRGELDDTGC